MEITKLIQAEQFMTIKCDKCGWVPKPGGVVECSGDSLEKVICPECEAEVRVVTTTDLISCKCGGTPALHHDSRGVISAKCSKCGFSPCIGHVSEEWAASCWNIAVASRLGHAQGLAASEGATIESYKTKWESFGKLYFKKTLGFEDVTKEDEMSKGLCIECRHHEVEIITLGTYGDGKHKGINCNYFFNPVNGETTKCSSIRTVGEYCGEFEEVKCQCKKHL